MLLVDRVHQRCGRRQDLVNEDEDGLLRRELDPLADDIDELANGEIAGDQVLLLVDGSNVRLFDFLADDLLHHIPSASTAQYRRLPPILLLLRRDASTV